MIADRPECDPYHCGRLSQLHAQFLLYYPAKGRNLRGQAPRRASFCRDFAAPDGSRPDFFIFGHFHCRVEIPVGKTPSKLLILKDWMDGECWIEFDASTGRYLYRSGTLTSGGVSQNIE